MNAQLRVRLIKSPAPSLRAARVPIGEAALENATRAAYQSAHTKDGQLAPLPLTLAEALAEAEQVHEFRQKESE